MTNDAELKKAIREFLEVNEDAKEIINGLYDLKEMLLVKYHYYINEAISSLSRVPRLQKHMRDADKHANN